MTKLTQAQSNASKPPKANKPLVCIWIWPELTKPSTNTDYKKLPNLRPAFFEPPWIKKVHELDLWQWSSRSLSIHCEWHVSPKQSANIPKVSFSQLYCPRWASTNPPLPKSALVQCILQDWTSLSYGPYKVLAKTSSSLATFASPMFSATTFKLN